MHRVIDIDDDVFTRLFDNGIEISQDDRKAIEVAIRKSIPLSADQRWISASEKLPDSLKDVLICFADSPEEYDVAYLRTTFNEYYKEDGAKYEFVSEMGDFTYADYEVLAWQTIEPYKEQDTRGDRVGEKNDCYTGDGKTPC